MEFIVSQIAIRLAIAVSLLTISPAEHPQDSSDSIATAAKKAFDQGSQELAGGNHQTAMTLLKTAVRIQPKNALYQHTLAKACLAAEQYPAMWVALRKAAILEPDNPEYSHDFLRMWRFHDLQGTLNIGVAAKQVLKTLGEPDQRIENEHGQRWIYAFMAVDFESFPNSGKAVARVLDLRGLTESAMQQVERIDIEPASPNWSIAHHQVSIHSDNLEMTKEGERIQDWTQMFSKQRFPLLAQQGAKLKPMLNSIQNSLKAIDPDAEFEIISESPTAIHYHWKIKAVNDNPAQHEIAKLMKGKKDFYRVAYVKKTAQLSPREFESWSQAIGTAKLIPNANPNAATAGTPFQAWELGKNLAFAALVRGQHGPEATVKKALSNVALNARQLKVTVPPPNQLTDDIKADTTAAIGYLLVDAGKPIYQSLQDNQTERHAALFELAIKSTLLALIHQPGDSTSNSIIEAIARSIEKANLNPIICQPLIDRVNEQADLATVTAEVQQFQMKVAEAISK